MHSKRGQFALQFSYHSQSQPSAVSDGDYVPVMGEIVTFNTGDVTMTHTIIINQDDICEDMLNEIFISNISLAGGIAPITVNPDQTSVIISDVDEAECSKG